MAKARRPRETGHASFPKRGEIYLTALDPTVGHEIKETRPTLVIQNDTSNRYSLMTLVAPLTSTVRLPLSPLHVLLPADSSTGLAVPSVAVFNQIRAVDRRRLIRKLGRADALIMVQVDSAIHAAFGLSCLGPDPDDPVLTRAIAESTREFKTGRYEP